MSDTTHEIKDFVPVPAQLADARYLLGWSVCDTARALRAIYAVPMTTGQLYNLEIDDRTGEHLWPLIAAYKHAGIEFRAFYDGRGQYYETRLGTRSQVSYHAFPWSVRKARRHG